MGSYDKWSWRSSVTNGKIPAIKLAEIEPHTHDSDLAGPAVMHPEAAMNMTWLLHAAAEDGVGLSVKYSYRTLSKQQEKWEDYQNGGNLAAVPGTSNHGWAVSVDFNSTDANVAWLRKHAIRYGFINDVPSERWHWTYQGGGQYREDDMTPQQEAKLDKAAERAANADRYVSELITLLGVAGPIPAAKATHRKLEKTGSGPAAEIHDHTNDPWFKSHQHIPGGVK